MEKKDEAEEEAKLQLRAQAKQELDDWYKQHAEQVDIVIIIHNTFVEYLIISLKDIGLMIIYETYYS